MLSRTTQHIFLWNKQHFAVRMSLSRKKYGRNDPSHMSKSEPGMSGYEAITLWTSCEVTVWQSVTKCEDIWKTQRSIRGCVAT